jgi:2-polyprenyl-6-methoxyphenol hydroxylase-like FAD-dependent oxidoreductase
MIAHCVHPLVGIIFFNKGQGLNLGIDDVICLTNVIKQGLESGLLINLIHIRN